MHSRLVFTKLEQNRLPICVHCGLYRFHDYVNLSIEHSTVPAYANNNKTLQRNIYVNLLPARGIVVCTTYGANESVEVTDIRCYVFCRECGNASNTYTFPMYCGIRYVQTQTIHTK